MNNMQKKENLVFFSSFLLVVLLIGVVVQSVIVTMQIDSMRARIIADSQGKKGVELLGTIAEHQSQMLTIKNKQPILNIRLSSASATSGDICNEVYDALYDAGTISWAEQNMSGGWLALFDLAMIIYFSPNGGCDL
jgi:hypothetical protein